MTSIKTVLCTKDRFPASKAANTSCCSRFSVNCLYAVSCCVTQSQLIGEKLAFAAEEKC